MLLILGLQMRSLKILFDKLNTLLDLATGGATRSIFGN